MTLSHTITIHWKAEIEPSGSILWYQANNPLPDAISFYITPFYDGSNTLNIASYKESGHEILNLSLPYPITHKAFWMKPINEANLTKRCPETEHYLSSCHMLLPILLQYTQLKQEKH